jgi:hypothetical protein
MDFVVSEKHTSPFSALKMEAVCSSERVVSTYKSTWCTTQKTNIDIFTAMRTSYLMIWLRGFETAIQKMEYCSYCKQLNLQFTANISQLSFQIRSQMKDVHSIRLKTVKIMFCNIRRPSITDAE